MALDQDVLVTSVGWANSYYGAGSEYVDEWGVGWLSVPYETPYGVGHYTEPRGHPLAAPTPTPSRVTCHPTRAGPSSTLTPGGSFADIEPTTRIVGSTVTTIFETAWALRGLEQLLTDFIEDPDLADEDPRDSLPLPSRRGRDARAHGRRHDLAG